MKIKFLGGVKSVTGSMHILESNGKRILIDCGLFQGRREESNQRNRNLPFDPWSIDRMVLSHAHIDHSGNIPTLVKNGYKNTIYSTFATRDLCMLMLRDSAFIQQKDAEFLNKKSLNKAMPEILPLYSIKDVEDALSLFKGIGYQRGFYVTANVKVTFFDAGHILGSSLPFFEIVENGKKITLLYAVDLGRKNMPILKDPYQVKDVDYLIIESTYGNRLHEDIVRASERLAEVVNRTYQRGGKIIIPAFSLERTQEMVYCLRELFDQKKIPKIQVFVDSPLSVNITEVFRLHPECLDDEAKRILAEKKNPFGWEDITYIQDVFESKKLNSLNQPAIIISGSGMCESGRILHHLRNNIENPNNTILIVGFMAQNTLGRKILERWPVVKIFGEEYNLLSEVVEINAFSAHADQKELFEYVENAKKNLKKVVVVHGEEDQSQSLAERIKEIGIKEVVLPDLGDEIEF